MSNQGNNPAEALVPLGVRALYRDEPIVRVAFELANTLGESREEALVRVIDSLHQALLARTPGAASERESAFDESDRGARATRRVAPAVLELQSLLGVIAARSDGLLAQAASSEEVGKDLERISLAATRASAVAAEILPSEFDGAPEGERLPAQRQHSRVGTPDVGARAPLGTLRGEGGSIVLGWAGEGVLLAAFQGHLSADLGEAYAARLQALLVGRREVQYFIDASAMVSFELAARTVVVRALVAATPSLRSIMVLRWSGGESPTGRILLQNLAGLLKATDDRTEFERELCAALGSESCGALSVARDAIQDAGSPAASEVATTS